MMDELPLPISYTFERSNEAYKESYDYINSTKGIASELSTYLWVYHSIHDIIPTTLQSFWSGNFFPYTESFEELQVSYNLCLQGFYKQAMTSLRSSLELGLLSVYWNIDDDGHEAVKKWVSSKEDTPRILDIWKKIVGHANVSKYQKSLDLKSRLLELGRLHNYVHTKGFLFANGVGIPKCNWQSFKPEAFHNWQSTFKEIVVVITTLHLLKYPLGLFHFDYHSKFGIDVPMMGWLDSGQISRIESIIDKESFHLLNTISKEDERVKNTIEWLENLPDISEEEVEKQVLDHHQSTVESMGFVEWKKVYEDVMITRGEEGKRLMNELEKWALEKDLMESKIKRIKEANK